jgi:LacI family transcriptional regulator
MHDYLSIYFPNSVHTGTEQVMRGIIAGAHAEAAACKCPYFIHRIQDIAEAPGSKGLMGMFGAARQKEVFLKLGIPLVNISNVSGPVEGMANVLSDDCAVGRMAADFLLEKGYQHFITVGQSGSNWSRERMRGLLERVQARGCTVQAEDLDLSAFQFDFRPTFFLDHIWEQITPLLRDAPLATGVFATNDWLAWPILQLFREREPERLHTSALLGVDNLHDQLFDPLRTAGLSSIQPGFRAVGARGLTHLLRAAREGEDISGVVERLPPEKLYARGSTAGRACEDPMVSAVMRELWAGIQSGDEVPLRTLARKYGMSMRNLELRFEAGLGQSARMLVADLRMERGMELLEQTDLSIDEVSLRCGYANCSTFSTLFRKKTGCTPRQWRVEKG